MYLEAHGVTMAAAHHESSNDAFCVAPELGVMAVGDGVGSHPGAGLASETAVSAFINFFRSSHNNGKHASVSEIMSDATAHSQAAVTELAEKKPQTAGMSTTLTACLFTAERVVFSHLGDSRAYLIRANELTQLTNDHTSRAFAGQEAIEQSSETDNNGFLLAAVGAAVPASSDIFAYRTQPEDTLLLCSDGLFNSVAENELLRICTELTTLPQACSNLLDAAGATRSHDDDITAVLGRLSEHPFSGAGGCELVATG